MKIFKKTESKEESKALENLVKENFCGKKSVIGCPYSSKIWCEKNCGVYINALNQTKYWNR